MKISREKSGQFKKIIRLMLAQQRLMIEAGSPEPLTSSFKAVIQFLMQLPDEEKARALGVEHMNKRAPRLENFISLTDAATLTLDEIEKIISDADISRKTLETIAIGRFQVPRGSMRSFTRVSTLREKIAVLVLNERTHGTIASVAKGPRG